MHVQVAIKVLEHGEEFMGCAEDDAGQDRNACADASGRRAALLEGAMTSTIKHPNVSVWWTEEGGEGSVRIWWKVGRGV